MILLVSKSPRSHDMVRWHGHPNVGNLVVPRSRWLPDPILPWAADNDAYSGFHEDRFRQMLEQIAPIDGCLFVTMPDVVGDANATFDLADQWLPEIKAIGKPVAMVAQDGMTSADLGWWGEAIDALFIGGSTEWKMGSVAAGLVAQAKDLGLWVHMGRVNTARRLRYAMAIGCDSVDGSSMAMFTNTHLGRFVHQASAPRQMIAMEVTDE